MNVSAEQHDQPLLSGCHIELHVTDLTAARAFYVETLGLAVLQESPVISLLAVRAGAIRLSIFGGATPARGNQRVHVVLGTEDLDATVVHLSRRGVTFAGPPVEAPGFCRFVQTRDPDGNLIEIAEYLRDPLGTA